jgi:hypothetical protein
MRRYSFQKLKAIWPYSLAAIPFIGIFAYLIGVVFPHRPHTADVTSGFTIPMSIDSGTVYISTFDIMALIGVWAVAAAIIGLGLWQTLYPKRP